MKEWRFLDENPAVLRRDWFPSADDWPDIAEYRAEHERLLALRTSAWDEACALVASYRAEDEARGEAVKAALVEGREPEEPNTTPPEQREDARREALLKWEKASDLLEEFVQRAIRELGERGEALYAALDAEAAAAEAKRAEAARLIAEADSVWGEGVRKRGWLDRFTGRAYGGYVHFEALGVPEPPEALDMDALLAGGAVTEVSHG